MGENCPGEFFRDVIEPLGDSFDPAQAAAYERIMRVWIPPRASVTPSIPGKVDTVYVLSRVTLGADIKIVSPILDAMKRRFPAARIVFVANRKSGELFAADSRVEHLPADYPRSGPVSARIEWARELALELAGGDAIVVDPDSRITQLGLVPIAPPGRTFHFSSRNVGRETENLSDLVRSWLREAFGVDGASYIATRQEEAAGARPLAAVSLGVGDNESKRVGGDFEARLIGELGTRYGTVWVDRGAGGEEARRVTAAVEASGAAEKVRFWEGGFAGFASIISQSDLYVGYDSAGQHAAAAAGIPLITIFAGAPSERFRNRWAASGHGR
ncbi:MAG TPA: hypothetical protein VHA14_10095, partial [Bryobacteraceae bacterium]|nr:hypothetical protein [Bryobacteraceae bacterium]